MRLDAVRGAIASHRLGRDIALAPKLGLPPDRRRHADAKACRSLPTRASCRDSGDHTAAKIEGKGGAHGGNPDESPPWNQDRPSPATTSDLGRAKTALIGPVAPQCRAFLCSDATQGVCCPMPQRCQVPCRRSNSVIAPSCYCDLRWRSWLAASPMRKLLLLWRYEPDQEDASGDCRSQPWRKLQGHARVYGREERIRQVRSSIRPGSRALVGNQRPTEIEPSRLRPSSGNQCHGKQCEPPSNNPRSSGHLRASANTCEDLPENVVFQRPSLRQRFT